MRGAVRSGLRLLALLTLVTGAPLVVLAAAEAVVRHHAPVTPDDSDDATLKPVPADIALAPGPLPQFVGRPQSRSGDQVTFRMDELELGAWEPSDTVVLRGIALAPWRHYRVVLLPGAAGEPRRAVRVETLGLGAPPGTGSLGVLPLYDLLALAAAPLVVAALVYLTLSSRRQARAEERGIDLEGLRPRRTPRHRAGQVSRRAPATP